MILSTVCPSCSKAFTLCDHCGKPLRDDTDHFCPHCGRLYDGVRDCRKKEDNGTSRNDPDILLVGKEKSMSEKQVKSDNFGGVDI